MRIKVHHSKVYEAAHSMTLALVTLYSEPGCDLGEQYNRQCNRPSAFMQDCSVSTPQHNEVQDAILTMCPVSKRVKLYIKKWALDKPSHYVILHKLPNGTFKLGCNRLLSCTTEPDALIDGVLMMWPDSNPMVACRQKAIIQRCFASGTAAPTEILSNPEIKREFMLAIDVANLYSSSDTFTVWTHPGKSVFKLAPDGDIVLEKTRPYATPPIKPNAVIYGDVNNNAVPYAPELSRHILAAVKGAEPMQTGDALLTRLLQYALESRLLPYLAIAETTTRGNIYTLSYDPRAQDSIVAQIGTNRKIVGLPQVVRINNLGHDVFVPDLSLAKHLKTMFFADSSPHIKSLRGLFRLMGYKDWNEIALAFRNWDLPMNPIEEEKFDFLKSEL